MASLLSASVVSHMTTLQARKQPYYIIEDYTTSRHFHDRHA